MMYDAHGNFVPNFSNPSDTSYDTPYARHQWAMARLGITPFLPSSADYCHAVDTGYSIFNKHDFDESGVCRNCRWTATKL